MQSGHRVKVPETSVSAPQRDTRFDLCQDKMTRPKYISVAKWQTVFILRGPENYWKGED